METDKLTSALTAAVDEAAFDLECSAMASDGEFERPSRQRVSTAEFHEVYLRERDRPVKLYARANVPDAAMTRLVNALRRTLGQFIHPDTDRIGHAFPVDGSVERRGTFRPDGLRDEESQSPLREFACALVQAAAIMGVKEATRLLLGWKHGQPVNLDMCTVLSGLSLAAPLTPRQDIQILPLALSTSELPRLPTRRDAAPRDYLGPVPADGAAFRLSGAVPPRPRHGRRKRRLQFRRRHQLRSRVRGPLSASQRPRLDGIRLAQVPGRGPFLPHDARNVGLGRR